MGMDALDTTQDETALLASVDGLIRQQARRASRRLSYYGIIDWADLVQAGRLAALVAIREWKTRTPSQPIPLTHLGRRVADTLHVTTAENFRPVSVSYDAVWRARRALRRGSGQADQTPAVRAFVRGQRRGLLCATDRLDRRRGRRFCIPREREASELPVWHGERSKLRRRLIEAACAYTGPAATAADLLVSARLCLRPGPDRLGIGQIAKLAGIDRAAVSQISTSLLKEGRQAMAVPAAGVEWPASRGAAREPCPVKQLQVVIAAGGPSARAGLVRLAAGLFGGRRAWAGVVLTAARILAGAGNASQAAVAAWLGLSPTTVRGLEADLLDAARRAGLVGVAA